MALSRKEIAEIKLAVMSKMLTGKRPPKNWWYRCIGHVEKRSPAYDPQKVCGALWYRKMSPAAKLKVKRLEAAELIAQQIKAAEAKQRRASARAAKKTTKRKRAA